MKTLLLICVLVAGCGDRVDMITTEPLIVNKMEFLNAKDYKYRITINRNLVLYSNTKYSIGDTIK